MIYPLLTSFSVACYVWLGLFQKALAGDSANNDASASQISYLVSSSNATISDPNVDCLANETRIDISFYDADAIDTVWIRVMNTKGKGVSRRFGNAAYPEYPPVPDLVSQCVPRHECFFVYIRSEKITPDDFSVTYHNAGDDENDGGNVDILTFTGLATYSFDETWYVAEVGNDAACGFSCNDNELLVEVKVAGASSSSFYVLDSDDTVLFERLSWPNFFLSRERMCLPKDSCTTLVSSHLGEFSNKFQNEFNVTVDGEKIENFAQSRAFSYQIGTGCNENHVCRNDESLLQIFIHRPYSNLYTPNMTWSVRSYDFDTLSGIISPDETGYSYTYHRECIPNKSCAKFFLSVPETDKVELDWEQGYYHILLDGVFYGGDRYWFGKYFSVYKKEEILGDECSTICQSGESLLDIALSTSSTTKRSQIYSLFDSKIGLRNTSSPTGEYDELLFDNKVYVVPVPLKQRSYYCLEKNTIDDGNCMELSLGIYTLIPFEYTVAVDGDLAMTGSESATLGLGGVCSKSVDSPGISGGAIAGIIVGALAAAWICWGLVFCFKKKMLCFKEKEIAAAKAGNKVAEEQEEVVAAMEDETGKDVDNEAP